MSKAALDIERVTRRRWLIEQTFFVSAEKGQMLDVWTVMEAVATTAMEHPEWDMQEKRTRAEWEEEHKP